ncbi:hypothetical protein CEXT_336981 [Caerostris extrusa]|uniref:Uncharacterized protein n=1 Tax=Caerostris extrusa TaxID=172846 RepID=A0AAV4SVM0_CAEEX|nr:hypothetical protein CEXT_336981 [Caerostris extrusa]
MDYGYRPSKPTTNHGYRPSNPSSQNKSFCDSVIRVLASIKSAVRGHQAIVGADPRDRTVDAAVKIVKLIRQIRSTTSNGELPV